MKNEIAKTQCCSTRHKFWSIVALVGLFACGWMVCASVNGIGGAPRRMKSIGMSAEQCKNLADEIVSSVRGFGRPATMGVPCSDDACVKRLAELKDLYAQNCAGRVVADEPKPEQPKPEQPKPAKYDPYAELDARMEKPVCQVYEELFVEQLSNEGVTDPGYHRQNIAIYQSLIENGCPENAEKYQALMEREQTLLAALEKFYGEVSDVETTCQQIERVLMRDVCTGCSGDSDFYIDRAKTYAVLADRGCPENYEKYKQLAAKDLEIARALEDDKLDTRQAEDVSDTYRRLQMQQTANEILNRVQKLTVPAIDFIMEAQRIIEE